MKKLHKTSYHIIGFFIALNVSVIANGFQQERSLSYEDSLIIVLEKADDENRARIVADITRNANFYEINHEPFKQFLEEAFEWVASNPDNELLNTLQLGKVNVLLADGNDLEAVRILTEIVNSGDPLSSKDSVSTYTFLFGIYAYAHAYPEAWSALMTRERVLDNNKVTSSFFENFERIRIGDLAHVYLQLNETSKAIAQFKMLKERARKEENLHLEAGTLNNLGLTWLQENQPDSAIQAFNEAIDKWKLLQLTQPENIAPNESIFLDVMFGNLGTAYNQKGMYSEAIPLLKNYLQANKRVERHVGIIRGLTNLSQSYYGLKNYSRSLALLDSASVILREHPSASETIDYLNYKTKVLEKLGRTGEAFLFYKRLIAFEDSISAIENKERLAVLQVVYEVEKKDKEIKRQELRALTAEIESRRNEIRSNLLLAGMLGSILVGAIFVILTIQWRKKNKQIERQNKIIESSLAEKEILLKEIHHRVKNNLQIICSFLNLQRGTVGDTTTLQALDNTQLRVMSMSLVHEILYNKDDIKEIDIAEYIPKLFNYISIVLDVNNKEVDVNYDLSSIKIDTKKAIPLGLIFNELITNAYKYAFNNGKKGVLNITAIKTDNYIKLIFSDNGPGFDKNAVSQTGEKTLGLQLIDDMLHQLKAQKKVCNKNGTKYEFLIPLT